MGARGRGVEAPAQVGAAPLGRLQLGLGVDHLLRLEGEDNEGGLKADGDERGDDRRIVISDRHKAMAAVVIVVIMVLDAVVIVLIDIAIYVPRRGQSSSRPPTRLRSSPSP